MNENTFLRRWFLVVAAASFAALLATVEAGAGPDKELRLVQTIPLPQEHSVATDIRWAGDHSVFISWDVDGVAEVNLDGSKARSLLPNLKNLGRINHYRFLASGPSALGVASPNWGLAWRPVQTKADGRFLVKTQRIPLIQGFDLSGDRVLLLGNLPHDRTSFSPKGEVAWVGSLHDQVEDLKAVLHDAGGAGSPNLYNCGTYEVGAVRFLTDGRFVIVPGFQDGVHLFDASGHPLRSWTNEQVGIDSHVGCATMSAAEEKRFRLDDAYLLQWIESHHLIDDILPLAQGPGLLIRSWGPDQRAHWALKALEPGGIKTYTVPVVGRRPYDRLHGDVRNGKIVLLLSNSGDPYSKAPADLTGEVLEMELP